MHANVVGGNVRARVEPALGHPVRARVRRRDDFRGGDEPRPLGPVHGRATLHHRRDEHVGLDDRARLCSRSAGASSTTPILCARTYGSSNRNSSATARW